MPKVTRATFLSRPHLVRKVRGLAESLDPPARAFGKKTLEVLHTLMEAVYVAREGPPDDARFDGLTAGLPHLYARFLAQYRLACERMATTAHAKAKALAVEMLNDRDAIFQVLHHPHLPLTNNEAERALRDWVILRRISYGTRTEPGSRVFAMLASVIETCRKRQHSPWPYLQALIARRRAGLPVLPLPVAEGV